MKGFLFKTRKQNSPMSCLQETHLRSNDENRLKVAGWKKTFHANVNQMRGGEPVILSQKLSYFIIYSLSQNTRDKKGYYIIIKWVIHWEPTFISYQVFQKYKAFEQPTYMKT